MSPSTRTLRVTIALGYGVILACLAIASDRRLTGDAVEYVALSDRVLTLKPFSLEPAEAEHLGIRHPDLDGPDGRQVLPHFWMLSLLASPFVAVARAFGGGDVVGFTIFNILLLTAGCWVCLRHVPAMWVFAAFLGPIIWWVDKAQVEVFTFTLIAMGSVLLLTRPGLSALVFGLAATQNPQLLALVLAAGAMMLRNRQAVVGRDALFASLGLALALLHPAYHLRVLGRPTALLLEPALHVPALKYLLVPLFDSNLGMLVNAPFSLAIIGAGLLAARRQGRFLLVFLCLLFFLFSFTQVPSVNHGGTVSMTRYALWLIPIVLVAFVGMQASSMRRLGLSLAGASLVWSLVYFRPAVSQAYLQPTRTALWLWTTWPDVENPLPEIFAERLRGHDGVHTLATTPDCRKVLLTGGEWPAPCVPRPVPAECQEARAICYANQLEDYVYRPVPRRPGVRIPF